MILICSFIIRAPGKKSERNDGNDESANQVDTSPIYATVNKLNGTYEVLSQTTQFCIRIHELT